MNTCAKCQKTFEPKWPSRRHQKYCSRECQLKVVSKTFNRYPPMITLSQTAPGRWERK